MSVVWVILMKLHPEQRVSIEEAQRRALSALSDRETTVASWVANTIWPGHKMTGQGAGAAASRILKRLEKQGLVRWTSRDGRWGWIRTAQARTGNNE